MELTIKWERVEGRRYEAKAVHLVIEGVKVGSKTMWTLKTWKETPIENFWTLKGAKAYAEDLMGDGEKIHG